MHFAESGSNKLLTDRFHCSLFKQKFQTANIENFASKTHFLKCRIEQTDCTELSLYSMKSFTKECCRDFILMDLEKIMKVC